MTNQTKTFFFAEHSEFYCKAVARYCLELCLFQEKLNIEIVLKAIKKFISMNSKDVGKIGCYWINTSAIDWFDQTFFSKTIILTCSDQTGLVLHFLSMGHQEGMRICFMILMIVEKQSSYPLWILHCGTSR